MSEELQNSPKSLSEDDNEMRTKSPTQVLQEEVEKQIHQLKENTTTANTTEMQCVASSMASDVMKASTTTFDQSEYVNQRFAMPQPEVTVERQSTKRASPTKRDKEPAKSKDKSPKKVEKPKVFKKKLIFNIWNTKYTVIDKAARELGYKTVNVDHKLALKPDMVAAYRAQYGQFATISPEEFDLVWFDLVIQPEIVQKLKPYQRVSQWPGIQVLTHKNRMADNLMIMKSHFPNDYNFFPTTYNLPGDILEFRKEFKKAQPDTFIVKPSHDCQGRGIYLLNKFEQLKDLDSNVVAQTYIDNPFLIDNLKFDLRIYVLLYGISPLKIYLFDDGLARFATNQYVSAKESDINNLFMHLTNYSINKNSSSFVQNDNADGGSNGTNRPSHKRSLKEIYRILESTGHSTTQLKEDVKDLIVKTIITGQNYLHHVFRGCQPDDLENQICFQVLGFDVMIDNSLKPWLIEINQSPSFGTDSAFDLNLKKKLMLDTFSLLNLTAERKANYLEEKMRTLGTRVKLSYEEKEKRRKEIDAKRDLAEAPILAQSGYERIFPVEQKSKMKQFNAFLKMARQCQDQFTHGTIKVDMSILNSMQQAAEYKEKLEKEREEAERKEQKAAEKRKRKSEVKYASPNKTGKKGNEEIWNAPVNKKEENIKKQVQEYVASQMAMNNLKTKTQGEIKQAENKVEPVQLIKQVNDKVKDAKPKQIEDKSTKKEGVRAKQESIYTKLLEQQQKQHTPEVKKTKIPETAKQALESFNNQNVRDSLSLVVDKAKEQQNLRASVVVKPSESVLSAKVASSSVVKPKETNVSSYGQSLRNSAVPSKQSAAEIFSSSSPPKTAGSKSTSVAAESPQPRPGLRTSMIKQTPETPLMPSASSFKKASDDKDKNKSATSQVVTKDVEPFEKSANSVKLNIEMSKSSAKSNKFEQKSEIITKEVKVEKFDKIKSLTDKQVLEKSKSDITADSKPSNELARSKTPIKEPETKKQAKIEFVNPYTSFLKLKEDQTPPNVAKKPENVKNLAQLIKDVGEVPNHPIQAKDDFETLTDRVKDDPIVTKVKEVQKNAKIEKANQLRDLTSQVLENRKNAPAQAENTDTTAAPQNQVKLIGVGILTTPAAAPTVKPEEAPVQPVPKVEIPLPRAIHEQPKPMSSESKLEKPELKQDPKPQVENLSKPTNEGKLPKKPELTILNKAKKMLETLNSPKKARNTSQQVSASKTANTSIKNEHLDGLMPKVPTMTLDEQEEQSKDNNQDQDMALPEQSQSAKNKDQKNKDYMGILKNKYIPNFKKKETEKAYDKEQTAKNLNTAMLAASASIKEMKSQTNMVTLNAAQINSPKVPSVTEQHQEINGIKESIMASPQKKMMDLNGETPMEPASVPEKKAMVEQVDDSIDLKDISLIDEADQTQNTGQAQQQQQQPGMPSSSRSKQIMERRALSRAANAIRRAKLHEQLEDLDKPQPNASLSIQDPIRSAVDPSNYNTIQKPEDVDHKNTEKLINASIPNMNSNNTNIHDILDQQLKQWEETKKVVPPKVAEKESSPKKEVRELLSKKPEIESPTKSQKARLEMANNVFDYQIMPKEKEVDIDFPKKQEVVIQAASKPAEPPKVAPVKIEAPEAPADMKAAALVKTITPRRPKTPAKSKTPRKLFNSHADPTAEEKQKEATPAKVNQYEMPKQKDWSVVQEIVQARRVEAILMRSKTSNMAEKDATPAKQPRPLFKPKKEVEKSADKTSHARSKSKISKPVPKVDASESSGIQLFQKQTKALLQSQGSAIEESKQTATKMNNYIFDKKQDFENDKKEKKEKKTSKKEETPAPMSLLKKNVQSTTPVKVTKGDKEEKPKKSKKEKKESKKAEKAVEAEATQKPITLLAPKVAAAEEAQSQPAKPELTPEELKAKQIRLIQRQSEAKVKFLATIDELKSEGKDPVFNLKEDFAIHMQIGSGRYAIIKKCTHRITGYKVALKTYEKKQLTKKSQLMAIHREIYILAGMDHPNIMRLFEVIDTKHAVNLVMELCLGQKLTEFTPSQGTTVQLRNGITASFLDENVAKGIFRQIADAVSYIHSLELVHRNLRISKIVINEETKEIKFTDFGQATSFIQNESSSLMGSMAEEVTPQAAKNKTQFFQSSDIRQIGIILFILMTGGAPSWSDPDEHDGFNTFEADLHCFPLVQNSQGKLYQKFSPELQNLLKLTFKEDVSGEQVLNHPWLR